ncbi:MAG: High-affinity nickel-transporter [Chloroflexi bacterium]|nr:High-affinity nickel-transporter [Chloroflexota bacterium]
MTLVVRALLLAMALTIAFPAVASAHPLGNFTVNRYSRLEVGRDQITLRYVLDLAEIPTLQELAASGLPGSADKAQLGPVLARFAEQLRQGAELRVAGAAARWTQRDATIDLVPGQAGLSTLRVVLTLVAPADATDGASLEYRDTSFSDRVGWREVVLRTEQGVRLDGATAAGEDQSDELRRYPTDPTRAPLAVSGASATIRFVADAGADAEPRTAGAGGARWGVDAMADGVAALIRAGAGGDALATLLALLAAAALGALHSLTPGHGKTVMAAYLVGMRGTLRQAVALGSVVALSHTAGVLGLALAVLGASSVIAPERVYPYVSALSALIVLGIGVYLVGRMIGRRAHTHSHAHGHAADAAGHDHRDGRVGWRALVALGVSGGLIPSASALLLLLAGLSLGRPDLGVVLIVMFGLGMGAVLVGIGLGLVGAGHLAERHFGDRPAARRIASLLPAATAVTVLLVGIALSVQAGQQLIARGI